MQNNHKIFYLLTTVLIILLGWYAYGTSFDAPFIWDDFGLITDNVHIRSFRNTPTVLTTSFKGSGQVETRGAFYRPLQIITYMADYYFSKLSVTSYHITNTILHIFVALCIYWLAYLLSSNGYLSFLTAVLFIAHPVHVESVSYISGRGGILSALFMLAGFICYIKNIDANEKNKTAYYAAMALSYTLALLSKEDALIFPALLLSYHYVFRKRIPIAAFITTAIFTCAYVILRLFILQSAPFRPSSISTIPERIPGFFAAILSYVRLLTFPVHLHINYGKKIFFLSDTMVIAGICAVILICIIAVKQRKQNPLLSFALIWFLITLLPVSNIYPLAFFMAEHFLYFPSFGFFLILARLLLYFCGLKQIKPYAISATVCVVLMFSFLTIKQNYFWNNPVSLYEQSLRYNPDNPDMLINLGDEYSKTGEAKKALAILFTVAEIYPDSADVYNNMGCCYSIIHEYAEAIKSFEKALKIRPNYPTAYRNLGVVYNEINKPDEAIKALSKAIEIDPSFAKAYRELATVYYYRNDYAMARKYFKKAIWFGYEIADKFKEPLGLNNPAK